VVEAGRCEVQRAGLDSHAGIQVHCCSLGQYRAGVAGHADKGDAQALYQRQQGDDLAGGAGIGKRQYHIVRSDHAHVAVAGLGGVHEEGGGAGAGQGGSDLATDMPRLAHADHNDTALAGEDQFAGLYEAGIDTRVQLLNCLDFQANGALRGFDQLTALAHGWRGRPIKSRGL